MTSILLCGYIFVYIGKYEGELSMSDLIEKLPIYIRIVEGVKNAIIVGDIKEEGQIPSTTTISQGYSINILTVNKANNILVDEGIIYKKRGVGLFVKKGAKEKLIKQRKKVFKEQYIKAALLEAKKLNIGAEELQKIVGEAFNEIK